jgi:hypothetical protein
MRKLAKWLVLLAAAAAPTVVAAQSADRAADEQAVRAVIQAFLDTREKNDAAGLAALLTPDVDQRQTSGNVRRGRDAVVSGSLATQESTGGPSMVLRREAGAWKIAAIRNMLPTAPQR